MSQTSSCPVCGRQGLAEDCVRCPQCDSDLTCFQVLEAISSSKAAPDAVPAKPTPRRFPQAAVLAGGIALVLLLVVLTASWKNRVPKLTALFSEPQAAQDQHNTLHLSQNTARLADGKIHIDAQIRILDDRKKQEDRQVSQSAAAEEEKPADKPAQKESQQASEEPSPIEAAPAAVVQETEQGSDSESKLVELAGPAVKQAVAAAPAVDEKAAEAAAKTPLTELPVLQGRRKRAVRAISVSGLQQVNAQSAKENKNKSTIVYNAQAGETVWELAERFYGEGKYYPLIMELNPQIIQGSVRSGGQVRLLADRRQAAALYQRSTEERGGLLLWKHKVQPGETWQSIYARFFPPRYSGMVFYPGDHNVVPGRTVKIILR